MLGVTVFQRDRRASGPAQAAARLVQRREYAEVIAAADRFGLTPTGFCFQTTLDAARNLHTGTAEGMALRPGVFEPGWHTLIEDAIAYWHSEPPSAHYSRHPHRCYQDPVRFVACGIGAAKAHAHTD
jgi:hypothetical protein